MHPLSEAGRIFTSFYIILNLSIFAYAVSVISGYFFEGELHRIFRQYIKGKGVKKATNHTIVVGFGRNGRKACEELQRSGEPFVIIESSRERIEEMHENYAKRTVEGDATHDETLGLAGLEKSKAIITTLPNDAENVFIALTARELNREIFIIARASEEKSMVKLERAGANKVVMPDALGGIHMAHLITKPYVNEFLELFTGMGNTSLKLEEFSCNQFRSQWLDKTILELDVRKATGATIVGFKDQNQSFEFNPDPNTTISKDDIIIVLGRDDEIQKFRTSYT